MNLIDDKSSPNDSQNLYPMMPLRDIVLYPHMVAPLVVGRKKSIAALEKAMKERSEIFLVTQVDGTDEDPAMDAVHDVGTIAGVLQLLRLPDGTIKALVEGRRRARVVEFIDEDEYLTVEVEVCEEDPEQDVEIDAYTRQLITSFNAYRKHTKKIPKEVAASLAKIDKAAKLVDVLSSHLPVKADEKQQILSTISVKERMELVLSLLQRESEIATLEQNIRSQVKQKKWRKPRRIIIWLNRSESSKKKWAKRTMLPLR